MKGGSFSGTHRQGIEIVVLIVRVLVAIVEVEVLDPPLVLPANGHYLLDGELEGREALEGLDRLANTDQYKKLLQPFPQIHEPRQLFLRGVRLHNQAYNLPALVPKICPQGVLVIPAEPGHHLFNCTATSIAFL